MSYYRARYKPLDQLVDLTDYQREPAEVSISPELEIELERELQKELSSARQVGPAGVNNWQHEVPKEPRLDAFGQRASSDRFDGTNVLAGLASPVRATPSLERGENSLSFLPQDESSVVAQLAPSSLPTILLQQQRDVPTSTAELEKALHLDKQSHLPMSTPAPTPVNRPEPVVPGIAASVPLLQQTLTSIEPTPSCDSELEISVPAGVPWPPSTLPQAAELTIPPQTTSSPHRTPNAKIRTNHAATPTASAVSTPGRNIPGSTVVSPHMRVRREGGEHRRRGVRTHDVAEIDKQVMERLREEDEEKGFKHQPLPAVLVRVVRLWWQEQEWTSDLRNMSKAQLTTLSTLLMAFLLLFITLMLLAASAPHRRSTATPASYSMAETEPGVPLMDEGVGKRDSISTWLSSRLGRAQGKRIPKTPTPPPPDWLLHDFHDLQCLANGTLPPPLAPNSLQRLSVSPPSTCWSMLERHHLYPRPVVNSGDLDTERSAPGLQGPATANVPSPALLDALRQYESMHKRCVGEVEDWSKHTTKLEEGRENCKYVVWTELKGNASVSTRLLSLVSAFLYSLITDRALLVQSPLELESLLCQPFPQSSWWAPPGMIPESFTGAPHQGEWVNGSTSNLGQPDLKRGDVVMVQLKMRQYVWDMQFFCDSMQNLLAEKATWILFNSDQYLAPGFFLVDSFRPALARLFPSRVLLQPLVRYLLHPSNAIWDRVTRIYEGYLYPADYRVGVEIDAIGSGIIDDQVNERVLQCGTRHGLFPHPITSDQLTVFLNSTASAMRQEALSLLADDAEAQMEDAFEREMRIRRGKRRQRWSSQGSSRGGGQRRRLGSSHLFRASKSYMNTETGAMLGDLASAGAENGRKVGGHMGNPRVLLGRMRKVLSVFVCSSSLAPYVYLKRSFSERPMEDHSLVTVHSESVEEQEGSRVLNPQQKSLAELWLLSMADGLLLSYMSSAGYIAAGLSGKVPLLMNVVDWEQSEESGGGVLQVRNSWKSNNKPLCERAWATEGCFLAPPQSLLCTSDPRGDGSSGATFFTRTKDTFQWLPFLRPCQDYDQGLTILPKFRFPTN